MNNYYKYLPITKVDENWGLCVLNAGFSHTVPNGNYPLGTHPEDHNFKGNTGRVLSEYQLIYITAGSGWFESNRVKQTVASGTVILLFPGEQHHYSPAEQTGWDEYWIGFKGKIMDDLVSRKLFTPDNPCINLGINEQAFNLFNLIIEGVKREEGGYQAQISGAILHLLGTIHAGNRGSNIENQEHALINRARLLFRSNITNEFSPEQAAKELMIGYSSFRKLFKAYTGISPGQFYIQMKIERAKEMLHSPIIPVKEIAYELRFESHFYFSKLFKEKTGLTPTAFRLKINDRTAMRFIES
jgi:AraC-like DNA-binding protein